MIKAVNSLFHAQNNSRLPKLGSVSSASPNFSMRDTANSDVFTPCDPYTQEQKLDLACRLAAYYHNKYENLARRIGCYV